MNLAYKWRYGDGRGCAKINFNSRLIDEVSGMECWALFVGCERRVSEGRWFTPYRILYQNELNFVRCDAASDYLMASGY